MCLVINLLPTFTTKSQSADWRWCCTSNRRLIKNCWLINREWVHCIPLINRHWDHYREIWDRGRGLRFQSNDRTDAGLISYLLYDLFSAILKKNTIKTPEVVFHIRLRAQDSSRGRVHWTETNLAMRSKPHDTVSLTMRIFLSLLLQNLVQI